MGRFSKMKQALFYITLTLEDLYLPFTVCSYTYIFQLLLLLACRQPGLILYLSQEKKECMYTWVKVQNFQNSEL